MNNYKLILEYDGHRYNGWQKQGNTENTIQGTLEKTISNYLIEHHSLNQPIEIHGSGRTDAGVNAYGQVANFKIKCNIMIDDFLEKMNSVLPKDIRVIQAEKVDDSFHSRLSATGKFYSYYIDNGPVINVFQRSYNFRIQAPLNLDEMKKAASLLVGEHDFIAFSTKANLMKSTIRTIYDIDFTEQNGMIRICFHGNGFLYNMVRILCGTLIEIGQGKRSSSDIPEILSKKQRALSGPIAPPNALFLDRVEY